MGLKGKIFKFMSDILKDGSYYKLYTQAKSTSACGLPKGFFGFAAAVHEGDTYHEPWSPAFLPHGPSSLL